MASSVNERELVLETLLMIIRDGEYSHIALRNVLAQYQYLDKRERAFITRVVNGTLERMIEIDYIINQFSKVKVNKMKPVIRAIIRSSVYQLKYMDSIPDAAVCNEAVKLAEKRGFRTLKGFVNGVLRNISRNLDTVAYPEDNSTEGHLKYLSVRYSIPEWMLEQWLTDYDEETVVRMAESFLEEEPLSVRCDYEKIEKDALLKLLQEEGVRAEEVPGMDHALYISGFDHLTALESFRKGYYHVQDVSSMQVAEWAAPEVGDYIIDVCAAPGGKALHAAELLKGTGHVEARDLTDYKVNFIRENIERSGLENIETVRQDATVHDDASVEKADIVIADLPCSGLGVLGRKPDLKYKMTEKTQTELAALQRKILGTIHDYVKPGGKLIYSTCTVNRAENKENARWFTKLFPEYQMIREEQRLPGTDAGDGFYIALFQRKKAE
jgi:16S rRNA (cytosine967-C5)-methyltransferase